MKIIECVPNFSEGRDRRIVECIIEAILAVPGLCLMDMEMDADHNRSVVTFVGEKEKVGEGALRAIAVAHAAHVETQHRKTLGGQVARQQHELPVAAGAVLRSAHDDDHAEVGSACADDTHQSVAFAGEDEHGLVHGCAGVARGCVDVGHGAGVR